MKNPGTVILVILAAFFLAGARANASETIKDYRSEITVNSDASMTVTETITVAAEGDKIKHGIYRDFPTRYKGMTGIRHTIGFAVMRVLKDGSPESYHIEDRSNGERVYIGKKNVTLKPGVYTYTITYRTDRQLGYFKDHDELYWNVTGNEWKFPIESATAVVSLPGEAARRIIETDAYTGYQGSKGKDFTVSRDPSGAVVFRTTRPLEPGEGITVVVTWPKGLVREPTEQMKRANFLADNRGIIAVIAGLLITLLYYVAVWSMVGRDPKAGVIMTRYTPPQNMSPAVMRFIKKMGYDDRVFAAAVIDMAVKRWVKIKEEDREYVVQRTEEKKIPLSADEQRVLNGLLGARQEIALKTENHSTISSAIKGLKKYLDLSFEKIYFLTHKRYFITGLILSIVLIILSGFWDASSQGGLAPFLFMCVWLSGWSVGVAMLTIQSFRNWRSVFRGIRSGVGDVASAIITTLFALPFIGGEVGGIYFLSTVTSPAVIIFLLSAIGINVLFYHLLKAPTRAGRRVLDAIDGFAVFLSATENDRLEMMNPPDRTPELFEKYLPYALALDLEQAWSEQFSHVLSAAAADRGGTGYSPVWYSGTAFSALSAGAFASSLGSSFSDAISSSSTAPGSSSGGGGGGSSGGGGGGGGGGGW
jgi:hypothetical protein